MKLLDWIRGLFGAECWASTERSIADRTMTYTLYCERPLGHRGPHGAFIGHPHNAMDDMRPIYWDSTGGTL